MHFSNVETYAICHLQNALIVHFAINCTKSANKKSFTTVNKYEILRIDINYVKRFQ